jgi:hypothetical protein
MATLSCAEIFLRSFLIESPPLGFYTNPRSKTLQFQVRQNIVMGTTFSSVGPTIVRNIRARALFAQIADGVNEETWMFLCVSPAGPATSRGDFEGP